jgi:hypothetical protein
MPEPWLKEISRSDRNNPGNTDKEYIQFQRGATTKTPMPMMKAWVDTTANKNNTWLVLTFHGVDGIGWEPLTHQQLDEYFSYIKAKKVLWVATFGDVTRYIRERQNATVQTKQTGDKMTINLNHSLNKSMYYVPLTLKTYVPQTWKTIKVTQGKNTQIVKPIAISGKNQKYVLYQAYPNTSAVTLSGS